MTSGPESEDLDREVEALADAAESDSETMANLKGLAVQLWANFDAYSVEELEALSFLLGRLLDQLCERLAARSLSAREVAVWPSSPRMRPRTARVSPSERR